MRFVRQIEDSYESIGQTTTFTDAEKAYADFHQLLEEINPSTMILGQLGKKGLPTRRIFDDVRSFEYEVYQDEARQGRRAGKPSKQPWLRYPIFRGTGTLAMGSNEAIWDVVYDDSPDDPVAEQYGNYQRVALRKLGQGILLGAGNFRDTNEQYQELERVLVENNLKEPLPTHHLGYAFRRDGSHIVATGATGMLPSEIMRVNMKANLGSAIEEDQNLGLFEWERDELAGYYDSLAATLAVDDYFGFGLSVRPQVNEIIKGASELRAAGQNLH